MSTNKLVVKSIFQSIDGEVNGYFGAGQPTTFVRFAGCTLGCSFCDTKYAQNPLSGEEKSVEGILRMVKEFGCMKVSVTGGCPLEQEEGLLELLEVLLRNHYFISLETNGAHNLERVIKLRSQVSPAVRYKFNHSLSIIQDYKLPSSGVEDKMFLDNFHLLEEYDWIKFVMSDLNDYERAKVVLDKYLFGVKANIAFSPVWGKFEPKLFVESILRDKLFRVHVSLQLHKVIWPECINTTIER